MEVFEVVLPILLIPLLGFGAARSRWLSESDCNSLSKVAFSCFVPSLLFISSATTNVPDDMDWNFLTAFYASIFIVYGLSILLGRYLFNYSVTEQGVFGMGCVYSNATVIGIPVCAYALGQESMLPLFVIISLHNLVLFLAGTIIVERNSLTISSIMTSSLKLLLQLLKSPITGSLIAGGCVNVLNISLYEPFQESFELISRGAIPLALFVLGASMNKYRISGHLKPALTMLTLKNIFLPGLVWFFSFKVFFVPPLWGVCAVVTSAMPTGISAYIFSKNHSACEGVISTGIVVSTVISIVTLSITLAWVQAAL